MKRGDQIRGRCLCFFRSWIGLGLEKNINVDLGERKNLNFEVSGYLFEGLGVLWTSSGAQWGPIGPPKSTF